ncbi:transforming growth factor-beta-induced protein ig-h3-like [Haliotis asinina]|uniref:transforming growth factor-beta-induced protein ig-h3-like n=1 Tax=Haliotis asinina TaxID=109174 RepID=UPI003531868C
MKTLLISLVAATVLGVVMSLPFQRDTLEPLIPLARSQFVHEANLTANFTRKAGNFTLFVPDNKAFHGLSSNITGNKTLLTQLILSQSVKGTYNRSELIRNKKLRTLSGRFLYFNQTKTKAVFVNGVNITGFNKRASNGFIFLVSKIVPQGSGLLNKTNNKLSAQLRRQVSVLCRNGTWGRNCTHHGNGTHGNFTNTVHRPMQQANFKLCINGTYGRNCTYHGNGTHGNFTNTVHRPIHHFNGSMCINGTYGRNCTHSGNGTHGNGTHGNGTICPNGTWGVNCTYHGNGTHGNMTHGSIAHILSQSYGQYSTLITDLLKSGAWGEIEGPQVTLLVPTNAAFSTLPKAYRNNLDNHASFLKSTMMYHILNGIHGPDSLHQNDMLTSLEGHRIHVTMQNGHVQQFNRVTILNVIHATNGVIYVLNGVLHLPSNPIV